LSDHADRFTVVIDTNVLVGALIRNMILSLAEAGLFRPRWSKTTLCEEFERAFQRVHGDQPAETAARQRVNIERAFPEGIICEDTALMESLSLPDPDDRHVLAAAIQTKAALIVTENLKDFPAEQLAHHEIEAISVDDFFADCIDLAGPYAISALRQMRERFNKPEMDADMLLLKIEQLGLNQTATMLSGFKAHL